MHAIIVMPIELAGEHQADGVLGELAALDQNVNGAVVERLRRMVGNLAVIGIRAAIEQQLRQFRMMSDARHTVERAFPLGLGLVVLIKEAGVRVGACIEQSRGGLEKAVGASGVKPEKLGEAEVRKRIPLARSA